MANPPVKKFRTQKGKDAISVNGYSYRYDKTLRDGTLSWRCLEVYECLGRVGTDVNSNNVQVKNEHCHGPDFDKMTVHDVRERLRQRAAEENIPIPQIYREETASLASNPVAAGMMPTLPSVSSTMYKDRHATLPPLPHTLHALVIPSAFQTTIAGQRFLLSQHVNSDFIIFATPDNLRMLCQADTLFMDGTFDIAPRLFSQVYTIHAFLRDRLLPLVYVLMSSKTTQQYVEVFAQLKQSCNQLGLLLDPTNIMTDFESGIIPAVRQEFPQACHKGCQFHHSQVRQRLRLYATFTCRTAVLNGQPISFIFIFY